MRPEIPFRITAGLCFGISGMLGVFTHQDYVQAERLEATADVLMKDRRYVQAMNAKETESMLRANLVTESGCTLGALGLAGLASVLGRKKRLP